jgi:hypothetical protein
MGPDDPSGLERLRYTEGVWRWIAILGLLVMMGGLALFGFTILSVFTATERIPRMPTMLPIAFGIAIVGALGYWAGLAFGVPRDSDFGRSNVHYGPQFIGRQTFYGPVDARVSVTLHMERETIVSELDQALSYLSLPRKEDWPEVEAAFEEVRGAVEADAQPGAIASRLQYLASVLKDAGAVAGGANAVIEAIKALAGTLGPAGRTIFALLGA